MNRREIGGSLTNTKRKDKRELGQRAKCHYLILLSRESRVWGENIQHGGRQEDRGSKARINRTDFSSCTTE